MLSHAQRIDAARSAIDFITGRTEDERRRPVPNCPGWTVYNAAAHIGRVGIAALDATTDTCRYFLPAMRRVTGQDPGAVTACLVGADSTTVGRVTIESVAPRRRDRRRPVDPGSPRALGPASHRGRGHRGRPGGARAMAGPPR